LLKVIFLLVLTVALAACGQSDNRPDINITAEEITLDIWYLWPHENRVVGWFAPRFQDSNPHIIVNTRNFGNDWEQYNEQLPLALAAGTAPDLFITDFLDYWDPNINNHLADWFPIMQAQNVNPNDWFMNVIHAPTTPGRLYAFPTRFNFTMVAANTLIPGLVDDLGQTAGITSIDLIEFARHSGQVLYAHQLFTVGGGVGIRNFIDMDTRTADFNNQAFVDAITFAKELSPSNPAFFGFIIGDEQIHLTTNLQELEYSQRYMFLQLIPRYTQYFLSIDNLLFQGRTPFVNSRGELAINRQTSWSISANTSPEQRQAAWDFVKFMQDPKLLDLVPLTAPFMVSTYKPLMRFEFTRSVPGETQFAANNWQFEGTREDLIAGGIAELERIAGMPVAIDARIPRNISNIWWDVLEKFESGYITAWDAAETLQDRVTLALREMD